MLKWMQFLYCYNGWMKLEIKNVRACMLEFQETLKLNLVYESNKGNNRKIYINIKVLYMRG